MSQRNRQTGEDRAGIVPALQDLTDGVVTLFRQHLQLFQVELRQDASIIGRYVGAIVFFGTIAFLGFALLNLATIFFAGWAFGTPGMAIATLMLALANSGIGLRAIVAVFQRMQEDGLGPTLTGHELQRSREWAKNIPQREAS